MLGSVVFGIFLLAVATAKESHVLQLTSDNFDEVIHNNEYVLVLFYAPWCGYCRRFMPEYEKAAATLAAMNSTIKMAQVDCPAERFLAGRFMIASYPTVKLFIRGKPIAYPGCRQEHCILSWLQSTTNAVGGKN